MTTAELRAAAEGPKLTLIGETWSERRSGTMRRFGRYRCRCGNIVVIQASNTRNTFSCGCFDKERRLLHGGNGKRSYNVWRSMLSRCLNPKHVAFKNYGGRGITVCERWRGDYLAFAADMDEPSSGLSIDRIDNDGNYEPGNCRWATKREQRLNARNARLLTINGITKTAFEWSQEPGAVNYECLIGRLQRNWPDDKAVFLPMQKAGGHKNKWSDKELAK